MFGSVQFIVIFCAIALGIKKARANIAIIIFFIPLQRSLPGPQTFGHSVSRLILDEAQKVFELMVRELTSTIVGNAASTITP